jgi:Helix-turn-helix of DDE superfamily endonuclease/DDE superfamily endonuclease
MPNDEEVIQRAGSLRAMTGLTQQEFTALRPHFEHACLAYRADRTLDGQPRTSRRYSTYETAPVPTMADKLLFILTYAQQHPIQEVQGPLFGMSQSNANTWIHLLHAVLNQALAPQEWLPARTADDWATLLAAKRTEGGTHACPFFHDGTERPIHRPKDPEDQHEYDSGKKKCHTRKNLLVINETWHLGFWSHTCAGKASDKSMAELAG